VAGKLRLQAVRTTLISLALILALAVAGLIGLSGGRALAQQVSCGDTITTDTTLDSDLINCPTNGIVIGADNVTLDLNGHTIDGDGTVQSCGPRCHLEDSGVSFLNHDGITVKDGSIRQFVDGLNATAARHIRLLGLATSRNRFFGITLAAAARVLVRNCSANRTTARERHREGTGLLVTTASGPGLAGRGGPSHHVRIVNSSFRHNAGDGIRSLETTDSVIKGNLLSGNDLVAFNIYRGRHLQVSRNRVVRNGAGILLDGSRNVIARNRITGGRYGVGIDRGTGNLLAGNVIVGAATGIRLRGELEPGRPGAVNTVIRGNRLRGANDDGLLVMLTAKHTLLRHNIVRHSQDDGFDVNDRTTKLTGNRAVRNADLGIEAVRGVNDGGGNRASGNGDPRQCVNVRCH
jgi:nitrous oxidase accessory protein NosD